METKADWLRSEIEKLKGMELKTVVMGHRWSLKDPKTYISELTEAEIGYNQALTSIITRYKEELKVLEVQI